MAVDEAVEGLFVHYLGGEIAQASEEISYLEAIGAPEQESIDIIADNQQEFLLLCTRMLRVPKDTYFQSAFSLTKNDRNFLQKMIFEGEKTDWYDPNDLKVLYKKIKDYTGYVNPRGE
ncbi:MAG: hypothetical protein AABX51_02245 [Nanoarchaeota archaeon]|mgnify:CR=1 FL=1